MWINFSASKPFAVKVCVGSVNAVSGESKVATDAVKQRRREVRYLASRFRHVLESLETTRMFHVF
jgi:hypothetical protein